MTYSECVGNLKMIKIMLKDNEQAEVIAQTIDNAIACIRIVEAERD